MWNMSDMALSFMPERNFSPPKLRLTNRYKPTLRQFTYGNTDVADISAKSDQSSKQDTRVEGEEILQDGSTPQESEISPVASSSKLSRNKSASSSQVFTTPKTSHTITPKSSTSMAKMSRGPLSFIPERNFTPPKLRLVNRYKTTLRQFTYGNTDVADVSEKSVQSGKQEDTRVEGVESLQDGSTPQESDISTVASPSKLSRNKSSSLSQVCTTPRTSRNITLKASTSAGKMSRSPFSFMPERNFTPPEPRLTDHYKPTLQQFTYGNTDVADISTRTDQSTKREDTRVEGAQDGSTLHESDTSPIARSSKRSRNKSASLSEVLTTPEISHNITPKASATEATSLISSHNFTPKTNASVATSSMISHNFTPKASTSAGTDLPISSLKKQLRIKRVFSSSTEDLSSSFNASQAPAKRPAVKQRQKATAEKPKTTTSETRRKIKVWKGSGVKGAEDILDLDVMFALLVELHEDIRAEVNTSEEEQLVDQFFMGIHTDLSTTLRKAHELKDLERKRKKLTIQMKRASKELLELSEHNMKLKSKAQSTDQSESQSMEMFL